MKKENNDEEHISEKEVDNMALAQKNYGFMISQGKEQSFFNKINENRPTEEFWNECETIRKKINQHSIEKMNILMDEED